MRLPIDNEIIPNEESHIHMENDLEFSVEALLKTREKLFEATSSSILLAQSEQKELYDRKHMPNVLQNGTKVLKENTRRKQRKGGIKLMIVGLAHILLTDILANVCMS